MIIYKITNKINNKCYIGKTVKNSIYYEDIKEQYNLLMKCFRSNDFSDYQLEYENYYEHDEY